MLTCCREVMCRPKIASTFRVVHATLLDHQLGAAFLAERRRLLGRLEDELDGALQLVAHRRQDLGDAHQDRDVRVVTARVHHAGFRAVPHRADRALERDVGLFGDRQRVHVGAQRNAWSRLPTLQHADDAGVGDLLLHFIESEPLQVRGNQLRGLEFAVAELGDWRESAAAMQSPAARGDRHAR
jgi:hypothetical protein